MMIISFEAKVVQVETVHYFWFPLKIIVKRQKSWIKLVTRAKAFISDNDLDPCVLYCSINYWGHNLLIIIQARPPIITIIIISLSALSIKFVRKWNRSVHKYIHLSIYSAGPIWWQHCQYSVQFSFNFPFSTSADSRHCESDSTNANLDSLIIALPYLVLSSSSLLL